MMLRDRNSQHARRVAIIVDSPHRDLPGAVLLAMRLCQQGALCYLVPFNFREPDLWALAPDFVLLPYLRSKIESLAAHLENAGIKVGVLDTEGGVMPDLQELGQLMTKNHAVRRGLACYCSWGTQVGNYLVKDNWFDESQVVATGTPRMDFYSDPWRQAILRRTPHLERFNKNLILFNGSFTVVNPAFATPEEEARAKVRLEGFDPESVRLWQAAQDRSLKMLAGLANQVATRFPEATVVYRPHPFERVETYHELLDDLENLHLIKDGSIYGWILRAKAVVQRGSSTAIEAGLAGVPALSPSWLAMHFPLLTVEAVSVQCENSGELFGKLRDILSGAFVYPQEFRHRLDQVTHDWFGAADGNSHQRVAQAISKALPPNHNEIDRKECLDLLYGLKNPAKSRRYRIADRIRRVFGLPVQWSFSRWRVVTESTWDGSEKFFDEIQVRELADAIYLSSHSLNGSQWRPVQVSPSMERRDYVAPYYGRSVTIALVSD